MHVLLEYRHLAATHTSLASISSNYTVQLAHQGITDCSIRVLSVTPTECFIKVMDLASRKLFEFHINDGFWFELSQTHLGKPKCSKLQLYVNLDLLEGLQHPIQQKS